MWWGGHASLAISYPSESIIGEWANPIDALRPGLGCLGRLPAQPPSPWHGISSCDGDLGKLWTTIELLSIETCQPNVNQLNELLNLKMTDKTSASNKIQLVLLLQYINSPLPFASDPLSARLPSWVFCHLHQTHNPLGLQSPLYCRWWHLSRFHLACSGTKSPLRQSVKCLFHWTVWHAMHLVTLLNCTSFIFAFAFEMSFCPVAAGIQSPYKRDSTSIPCTKKDSAWQVWPLSRCLSARKQSWIETNWNWPSLCSTICSVTPSLPSVSGGVRTTARTSKSMVRSERTTWSNCSKMFHSVPKNVPRY